MQYGNRLFTLLNWGEHSFLPPLPPNGGAKEVVFQCTNVLTIIQNSLEAINTLDPPSIARNACLSRSSLQMPFFRNLILVLLLPLVSWTGTWGVHACRACYDNWTSNWMVGDEGVYKCPMWSRALGPWYTHCMCIMWNGPWFLQISIDSMLVA